MLHAPYSHLEFLQLQQSAKGQGFAEHQCSVRPYRRSFGSPVEAGVGAAETLKNTNLIAKNAITEFTNHNQNLPTPKPGSRRAVLTLMSV